MSDNTGNNSEFDFELPPLPKLRPVSEAAKETAADVPPEAPAENEPQKKLLSIDDILSAPNNRGDVVIPKDRVDTSTVKRVTSGDSVDRTMAEAEKALEMISKNSAIPFEKAEELPKPDNSLPDNESMPHADDSYELDPGSIQLSEMNDNASSVSSGADEAARALKNMVMLDDISMEMSGAPKLDEMSYEYGPDRKKANGDELYRKDKLSANEKKAIKDRMHEEIYRRPQDFDKVTGDYLESRLIAENRLKKAKKGLLLNILDILFILGCAAGTYLGLHEYNEAFTYLAAVTLISGLLLLIRAKGSRIFTIVYLVLNTLILAVPGLGLMILNRRDDPTPNFDGLIVVFTVCIVLSGLALFILSTSSLIRIYFTTDNEGNEK